MNTTREEALAKLKVHFADRAEIIDRCAYVGGKPNQWVERLQALDAEIKFLMSAHGISIADYREYTNRPKPNTHKVKSADEAMAILASKWSTV